MNYIILYFLFSICFSLSLVQAQCDQPILKTISFTNGTEVETSYCGTVNDRGQRDGQGRLEYINYDISYEEGIWKNDQLNGEGKTVSTNGQEYEGVYENGQLIKGVFTSNINGDLWTYNGEFNGNYFQGVGIERREVDNQIIIKEGDFFSDKLYQGTETVLFTNSGIKIISEYVKGISTVVSRNDINTYNTEDVVGDTEFIEVGLLQRGTVVDSRLAYDVELEINGVKGEWLKINEDDSLIKYMDQHVFDVIEKVIENSKLKIVLSVGKAYYDIFNDSSGFIKLEEISSKPFDEEFTFLEDDNKTYKNIKDKAKKYKPKEKMNDIPYNWPMKFIKRSFSIWERGEVLYLNTYASGSNTPPAEHFNEIQNELIRKHLIK